ncbi:GTA head formation protein, RCAP_rcc01685 family [Wenxinia marina]|uniref:Uncharacterized protein n=1 Tax=Wenxinia marina DSM 24838 TaxID=1123501 RepID=A0A0D0NNS6_9RHOB|nr:hypothetical protein [Wenxinia marina]KIQ69940.1 hypothetical protein Wenmar_01510 [Wenxinia marina DSM 24838]GGL62325.1 hypothetical protein GCM10011392_16130 [Wenxinia marina]
MTGRPTERFACAPGLRIDALERLSELQFEQAAGAMARLEAAMERLERRLWLAVFGMVAAVLAEAVQRLTHLAG